MLGTIMDVILLGLLGTSIVINAVLYEMYRRERRYGLRHQVVSINDAFEMRRHKNRLLKHR